MYFIKSINHFWGPSRFILNVVYVACFHLEFLSQATCSNCLEILTNWKRCILHVQFLPFHFSLNNFITNFHFKNCLNPRGLSLGIHEYCEWYANNVPHISRVQACRGRLLGKAIKRSPSKPIYNEDESYLTYQTVRSKNKWKT